jgi:hypothetical protein
MSLSLDVHTAEAYGFRFKNEPLRGSQVAGLISVSTQRKD